MEKWSLITFEETCKNKRRPPEIPTCLVLEAKPAVHVPSVVPSSTCENSSSLSVSQQLLLIYDHTPDSNRETRAKSYTCGTRLVSASVPPLVTEKQDIIALEIQEHSQRAVE